MYPLKFLVLSLTILSPIFINGQNLNNKTEKKISIGINFSPDYTYRKYSSTYRFTEIRNELEDPRLSYTTGLNIKYKFNRKFAVISGIQLSDKGYQNQGTKDDFEVPDIYTTDDPSLPEKFIINYHDYYLGIPIKVNYYFLQQKVKMFFSMGSSLDFFLNSKQKITLEFKDRTQTDSNDLNGNFNKINLIGIAGLGIESNIFSDITFRFEPVFRYSLTRDLGNSLNQHFYSIGANMALLWNF